MMILGIDIGTSSVKILSVGKNGCRRSFSSKYAGSGAAAFYHTVARLMQDMAGEIDLGKVSAVGFSSQSCSYILYDGAENQKVYSWNTPEGQECVRTARDLFTEEEYVRHISMPCPSMNSYPIPRALWFQKERRGEWDRAVKLLQPKDYLYYRFTGKFASDKFMWRGLANMEDGSFHGELLSRIGVDREKLPELYDSFGTAGGLTAQAASDLGLREGTPVYLGCNDYYASLLGMGITGAGQSFDITGTSEHVGVILPELPRREELIGSPYIDGYVLYGVTSNSGRSIRWAFENFGGPRELAPEEALRSEPPVFLPYLDGERAPVWNTNARGVFFGLTSSHGSADFLYSVLEGVAFSLCHIWNTIGVRVGGGMKVSGGASVNGQLNRMKASLFGRPLQVLKEKETSALGAVMCASIGSGRFASLKEAVGSLVETDDTVEPEERLRELLLPRYEKYIRLSSTLMEFWK